MADEKELKAKEAQMKKDAADIASLDAKLKKALGALNKASAAAKTAKNELTGEVDE